MTPKITPCVCLNTGVRLHTQPHYSFQNEIFYQHPYLTTCNCWHGKFMNEYYHFPDTRIDRAYMNDSKDLVIVINDIEYTLSDIIENHIKNFK